MSPTRKSKETHKEILKAPTGIKGFDDITFGGLPRGRPTLVAGGAGSGKTMFCMEFIVHGAMEYNEPGIYVSFEENINDLKQNFRSLGYDLDQLAKEKKMILDHVFIERSMIEETGEYDLEALFIRLGYAIDSIGAKRVALDTIEVLFAGLTNHAVIRSELLRLFRWLKDRGITAVVTGERGENTLTRYGLEEYIADCVILLDNRITEQLSTRRLRIIKYRGSSHGGDEYPFLIGRDGVTLFPVTSIRTDYKMSKERVSTGLPRLDMMLGNWGYYRGSSILYSGSAGTGKTSFAAFYVDSACRRGERCMFFAMEETESEVIRNMESIGLNLQQWVDKGLLKFEVSRPSLYGLEMHLVKMEDAVNKFQPLNVVIDPMTDLSSVGSGKELKSMLTRLLDQFKSRQITIIITDLLRGDIQTEKPGTYISSLIDTWVLLRNIENNGERNRGLTIIKSRGMSHSNQVREFVFSSKGVDLISPYIGPSGVFMGSGKIAQEARDQAAILDTRRKIEHTKASLTEMRRERDAKAEAVKAEYAVKENELLLDVEQAQQDMDIMMKERQVMAGERRSDVKGKGKK